ncbi:MAG: glycoside hydrolase family 2 [Clostridia bacterium]|nr:glycoside hydrolase family 2 [Clostridia bacterium]
MSEMMIKNLPTPWSESAMAAKVPMNNYPRPQLRRAKWFCLNGMWKYAICDDEKRPAKWDGEIRVPYSPESLLSGVERQVKPGQTLWYERLFKMSADRTDRLLLHFGAVDQRCTVYMNGKEVGSHEGGYHPFSFDVTEFVAEGVNRMWVKVKDDCDQGDEAYGKQKIKRGGIWYTGQSGIWQTVWMEFVPQVSVGSVKITPLYDQAQVEIRVALEGGEAPCTVQVLDGKEVVASGETADGCVVIDLPDFHPWSCEDPFLYKVKIEAGEDKVESYFGMRSFGVTRGAHGRKVLTLNGKPIFHHGLLDQGYWSDGMYTPPSDAAMIHEIKRLKEMGFNMLRKHIKIEPLRWYYHCDKLGMLVWQDFVSGGEPQSMLTTALLPMLGKQIKDDDYKRFGRQNPSSREKYMRDADRTMDLLYNCVSLCCWVPFNEGWGQFDAAKMAGYVREKDSTRYIDHASGWHDQGAGDFQSSHIYFKPFKPKADAKDRVMVLSEFGGYSLAVDGHMASEKLFGYKKFENKLELQKAVFDLYHRDVMHAITVGLSAAVYTQVSDVEDEINGLFTYDRAKEKFDAARMKQMGDNIQAFFLSVVEKDEEPAEPEIPAEEIKAEAEEAEIVPVEEEAPVEESPAEEAPAEEPEKEAE